jgi:hypothetical protein
VGVARRVRAWIETGVTFSEVFRIDDGKVRQQVEKMARTSPTAIRAVD